MRLIKKDPDIQEILLTPGQIRKEVKKLADRISKDFSGKKLVIVCILKGSIVFLADLIRFLKIPCSVDFVSVASYGKSVRSSGVVRVMMDLRESPEGKDLLIIEDLLDTGLTMDYLLKNLKTRNPRSLKICVLLDKPGNRKIDVQADYVAFNIPNKFVVGYGLDYDERYRALPYIGTLKESIYSHS